MNCKHCGKEFDNSRNGKMGRKSHYCCVQCKYDHTHLGKEQYTKNCLVCENVFKGWSYQKYCSKKCRDKRPSIRVNQRKRYYKGINKICHCIECGKAYHPKKNGGNKHKYCSRECYFESVARISREREFLKKIRENNTTSRRIIEDYLNKVRICYCKQCKKMFMADGSRQSRREYCSDECIKVGYDKWQVENGYLVPDARPCKRCGTALYRELAKEIRGSKTYCAECAKLISKAQGKVSRVKRRHQCEATRIQLIISIDVFMRDKWKCQLCGCDVDELGDTNKDNYANLDHVIPLAKGGHHILSNVQTLCRKCNIIKSDKMPEEITEMIESGKYKEWIWLKQLYAKVG